MKLNELLQSLMPKERIKKDIREWLKKKLYFTDGQVRDISTITTQIALDDISKALDVEIDTVEIQKIIGDCGDNLFPYNDTGLVIKVNAGYIAEQLVNSVEKWIKPSNNTVESDIEL